MIMPTSAWATVVPPAVVAIVFPIVLQYVNEAADKPYMVKQSKFEWPEAIRSAYRLIIRICIAIRMKYFMFHKLRNIVLVNSVC